MSIRQDSVVTLHYTLKDEAGEVLDSSASGPPLTYLHGHGHLVPGLERSLEGRSAGEKLSVKVALDGNHPLAGQSLDFEIEITAVRDATEEELAHGHVHGSGGHHH